MSRSRIVKASTARRRRLMTFVKMRELASRACKNCLKDDISEQCRVDTGYDKCIECQRLGRDCDLSPFNPAKWSRLQIRRDKLRSEFLETFAQTKETFSRFQKSYVKIKRLQKQLDFLKTKKRKMMKVEVRNIANVKREEIAADESLEKSLSAFLAGFSFESFELLEGWKFWLQNFFVKTVAEASDSSWDFLLILKCLRYVRNLFT